MGHIRVNGWCWRGATRALQQEAEELLWTREASPKKYWLSSEKSWWWRTRRAPKMRRLRSLRKRQPCPSSNRRSAGIPSTSQITSTSCTRKLTSSRWTTSLSSLIRDHCCHIFQAFVSKLAAEAFSDMAQKLMSCEFRNCRFVCYLYSYFYKFQSVQWVSDCCHHILWLSLWNGSLNSRLARVFLSKMDTLPTHNVQMSSWTFTKATIWLWITSIEIAQVGGLEPLLEASSQIVIYEWNLMHKNSWQQLVSVRP